MTEIIPLPSPPVDQEFVFRCRPGSRASFGYQFTLFLLVRAVSMCTRMRLTMEKLAELNLLFVRAEDFGAYTVEWAGCVFRTVRDPYALLEVDTRRAPNRRELDAQLAQIALRLDTAHRAYSDYRKRRRIARYVFAKRRHTFSLRQLRGA